MRFIVAVILLSLANQSLAATKRTITVSGSRDDRQIFEAETLRCQTVVGDSFSALVNSFILRNVPLRLSRAAPPSAYLFGVIESGRTHTLILDHLLSLPEESRDAAGRVTYPRGVPNWATTRCVALAHELAEAYYEHVSSSNVAQSHAYAIGKENQTRRALGQSQCRQKEMGGNEQIHVPHTDHNDFVLRIGHHTERYHRKGTPVSVTVSYEEGSDSPCQPSNYDATLPN